MRLKVFAAVAALAAIGTAAVSGQDPNASAPDSKASRRARIEAARAEIGLSEEQVTEIRRIHNDARKAAVRRHADLRVARMELDELMGAATLDEAAIQARVKTIADLQAAALRERTESRLAVRKLVTPEQFQKMQQLKRHAFRAQGARHGRGPAREGARGGPDGGEDASPVEPIL